MIVDAGRTLVGVESTILRVMGDDVTLLRAGGIAIEDIEAFLQKPIKHILSEEKLLAPGMMQSHYAPKASVFLNAQSVPKDAALINFGGKNIKGMDICQGHFDLSVKGDLAEAAHNLFHALRMMDQKAGQIYVVPIPNHGLGVAINDRFETRCRGKGQTMLEPRLIDQFIAIVGAQYALTKDEDIAPHMVEWRKLYRGVSPLVLKPKNTDEVAQIIKLAPETGTAIVPQGGNTGLVGAQIPDQSGTQIVLNLSRLNEVREIDEESNTITVGAGATLQSVQQAADGVGRLFPLSLASKAPAKLAVIFHPMPAVRLFWLMAICVNYALA